ncbi:MAG: LexA family transcriptional regulator [Gammaproteobacteria bacterium]
MSSKETKDSCLETLSDRLVLALEMLNITQADLARKIQVKPQAINYLCKNKTKKSQLTYDIAEALNISGEWLANGVGLMNPEDDPHYKLINAQNRVPILAPNQVKPGLQEHFLSLKSNENISNWLLTTANTGKNGFAIIVQDKSMYPRFDQGTIIVVNPEKQHKDREFVLAYISSIDDVIFRQVEFHNDGSVILYPINTAMYKQITLEKNDQIIGALVEARWQT